MYSTYAFIAIFQLKATDSKPNNNHGIATVFRPDFRLYDSNEPMKMQGVNDKMVRKLILVLAMLGLLAALTGCQTVAGLGRDITWTAEASADWLESQ